MQNQLINTIDDIQIHLNSGNIWIVNLTLAIVMFGVALDIKTSDFTNLLKSPKPVIVGIVSQFVLIPMVTYIMVILLKPHPSVALGMFMVAACPGGSVSNFMTKMAKGNSALSVSLTSFASFAALIMTPLNFSLWGNFYEPTAEILHKISLSPYDVGKLVLFILGIPLVLGMLFNYHYQILAQKIAKILKPLSVLIFLSFIVVAFYNNIDIFITHIHYVFFIVIFQNLFLLITGFYAAKFTGLSYENQKTISIESGIQNSGLGLLLVFSFFQGIGGMALLVAFWAIWDIFSGLAIAFYWSFKSKKTNLI